MRRTAGTRRRNRIRDEDEEFGAEVFRNFFICVISTTVSHTHLIIR